MNREILRELRGLREDVAKRLDALEELARNTQERTQRQEKQIEENQKAIEKVFCALREVMEENGLRTPRGTVVPKEEFYEKVEAQDIPRRAALRTLREEGIIRGTRDGRSTAVQRRCGRAERVILVVREVPLCKT